ncbi:helix-turn-helix domain-containing protein [Mucilaginibacter sp. PAMB04168]|uniref:helix-turn-helix domain-containing protein n=1 Tax=Mucilaginibacter sp. PAMB04168 TaxID=3138567 RepID=UPI0031F63C93
MDVFHTQPAAAWLPLSAILRKRFHTTPSRWLQQQRLREAYHLLEEKGRRPSEAFLEHLSHFSFAFKKAYDMAPSTM